MTQQDHPRHGNDTTTHRKISALPHMIIAACGECAFRPRCPTYVSAVSEALGCRARVAIATGGSAEYFNAGTFLRTQTWLCRLDRVAGLSGASHISSGIDRTRSVDAHGLSRQSAEKSCRFCCRTPSTGYSSFKRHDRRLPLRSASVRAPAPTCHCTRHSSALIRIVEIARRCVFAGFIEAAASQKFFARATACG